MDVVIVGAGTFGASLAWWLTRAGERVTLVDQFEPGDRRASSGGETRLLRCAHGLDAEYTAMAHRAWTLWRELEDQSGENLLVECGMRGSRTARTGGRRLPSARSPGTASRSSASTSRARRRCIRASVATTSRSCC
jgi:glycine/D-amino acid oxidase-like deaminating enzyme